MRHALFEAGDINTLYDITTSSRMFHDEPERTKQPDERCEVTATIAKSIRGKIALNGGALVSSDLPQAPAGDNHTAHYARIRVYTLENRSLDGSCHGGSHQGRQSSTAWAIRIGNGTCRLYNAPNGSPRCCLCWMNGEELLEDLQQFLISFDAQVDVGIAERRAQQHG